MAILDDVVIAAPCPISWDNMTGDDRVRHCSGCDKHVYNIADMTDAEASDFFTKNGSVECVRIFRRTDGKIMTDNCPKGLRIIRNRIKNGLKFGAGIAAAIFTFIPGFSPSANAQQASGETKQQDTKGDVYIPPVEAKGQMVKTPRKSPQIMMGGECSSTGSPNTTEPQKIHPLMGKIAPARPLNPVNPQTPGDILPGKGPSPSSAVKNGASVKVVPPVSQDKKPDSSPGAIENSIDKKKTKADSRAYDKLKEAQESEAAGKNFLALLQYQEAIAAANEQYQGDPGFLNLLNRSLENLKSKMMS